MGLKDLFFEKVDEEPVIANTELHNENDGDVVNTETISYDNLVIDIYSQNNLSDVSRSIFKIEELINSLPKEMPNETKKTTVLSMLAIFGLTVEEIVEDGKNRITIIDLAREEIINENNDIIVNNNEAIEKRKLEIQEFEQDTSMRETIIKNSDDTIENEIKRISKLINFVGGVK